MDSKKDVQEQEQDLIAKDLLEVVSDILFHAEHTLNSIDSLNALGIRLVKSRDARKSLKKAHEELEPFVEKMYNSVIGLGKEEVNAFTNDLKSHSFLYSMIEDLNIDGRLKVAEFIRKDILEIKDSGDKIFRHIKPTDSPKEYEVVEATLDGLQSFRGSTSASEIIEKAKQALPNPDIYKYHSEKLDKEGGKVSFTFAHSLLV